MRHRFLLILACAAVLGLPAASASAASFVAHLKAPNHHPKAGTKTCSTYIRNVAALSAPSNASGARTPSRPIAAITVTDSHDAGADASTRSPLGARP